MGTNKRERWTYECKNLSACSILWFAIKSKMEKAKCWGTLQQNFYKLLYKLFPISSNTTAHNIEGVNVLLHVKSVYDRAHISALPLLCVHLLVKQKISSNCAII